LKVSFGLFYGIMEDSNVEKISLPLPGLPDPFDC